MGLIFVLFIFKLSMYNKSRNRGLAFVTMGSPEEAVAALNNLEAYVSIYKFNLSPFYSLSLTLIWFACFVR